LAGGAVADRRSLRASWLVVALLALPTVHVGAQGGPRFARFGTAQGLSESSAEDILQDRRGFIWVATPDGLNRFDGYSFTVFRNDPDDPRSLSDNSVKTLLQDGEGRLWVGTDGGLNRFDRDSASFVSYRNDPRDPASLSNDVIESIAEGPGGFLWVSTFWGLNRLDPESGEVRRYLVEPAEDSPEVNHALASLVDRRGRVWVASSGAGLGRLDPDTGHVHWHRHDPGDPGSLSSDICRTLLEDPGGGIWVGTEGGGLDLFDPGSGLFSHHHFDPEDPTSLGSDFVRDLMQDSRGRLWISTDAGGVNRLDRETGGFKRLRHDPRDPFSLSSDSVRSTIEDSNGDLWVATYAGGINLLEAEKPALRVYRAEDDPDRGLSASSVNCFFEEPTGELWIGTDGGLNRFDRSTGRFERWLHDPDAPETLSGDAVRAILRDHDGRLWIGTFYGGLDLMHEESGTFSNLRRDEADDRSLSNNNVWALLEDSGGGIWVGTFGGLNRLDPVSRDFEHFRHDEADPASLAHDVVWALFEDSRGRLWVGTQDGLSRFDREKRGFVNYRNTSHPSVLAIHEDRAGRLWLGTRGGGLDLLDEASSSFRVFRTSDGLPSDVVVGILEDDSGCLWLSTNAGLSRFDPESGTFRNYDVSDGLQDREFNRSAYLRLASGELAFGGIRGFNLFRSEDVRDNPFVPPVVLTGFRVFDREVEPEEGGILERDVTVAERAALSHEHSVFSISYAALSYRHPERNRYAYRMEGFDDEWTDAGYRRSATYTNLDPGQYVFRVRGSNNSGVWNEAGTSIRIAITPPWWGTGWFRGTALLTFAAALLGAHRLRTRRIEARNRALQAEVHERLKVERERSELMRILEQKNKELESKNEALEAFAYTVSHDLQAPLVTIQGFIGYVEKDAEAGNIERLREDIGRVTHATRRMGQLLSDVLALSRSGRDVGVFEELELSDLVDRAVSQVSGALAERGVAVEVAPELPAVFGDRTRLIGVFQNLLGNAVRFMGDVAAPRIEIGARREGDWVTCSVRDNGVGIEPGFRDRIFEVFTRLEPDQPGTGLGLALVKRIVTAHGGRVWVESGGRGTGATFWLTLPGVPAPGGGQGDRAADEPVP